ncbi:MAG: hypothetical protein K0R68_2353 [Mycobacterium sp.]|jgi:hypothetical protein|nr:hypothetical protein [Mycobacterium sp.]
MLRAAGTTACCAALLLSGCSHQVGGVATMPYSERPGPTGFDVDSLMLELSQMRALTGAGDDLTVIPTMDGKSPVDIDLLARDVPEPCRFIFAETATFGSRMTDFHKTTYQSPPDSALISQAAAAYSDPGTARAAFGSLTQAATACADTSLGPVLVGDVSAGPDALGTRTAATCGRDYRVKAAVLAEVTFCAFPESISELVMVNLLRGVPG